MNEWQQLFQAPVFRLVDHSRVPKDDNPQHSFAADDALATSVGNGSSPPVLRTWVHDPVVILGIPDARLPHIEPAVRWLHEQGYKAVVRNSGGLAVVLDKGVLNVSIILPDAKQIGIHRGYEAMTGFIQHVFREWTTEIEAFEVAGSYCPGEYDLSINGKKFAGISQRRVRNGTAVQIYLCVEGSGQARAELVREFYRIGIQGEKTKFVYPEVRPETMASLEELFSRSLTVRETANMIEAELAKLSGKIIYDPLSDEEEQWYSERLLQMQERNQKALGNRT